MTWTLLAGSCPDTPGNCLMSVPGSVRVSCMPSTSANQPTPIPIGTPIELQLRVDGEPHRQWTMRTTGIDPLNIDHPPILDLPASDHRLELWADCEIPVAFDLPVLWHHGEPRPSVQALTMDALYLGPEIWVQLHAPMLVPKGFTAANVAGTVAASRAIRGLTVEQQLRGQTEERIEVTFALTIDGSPREDRLTRHWLTEPESLGLQELVPLTANAEHIIQVWGLASEYVIMSDIHIGAQLYTEEKS